MKLIAAVDENWAIGNKGKLLTRISADQKFFKNTTMGHVVVLGRKTLEEFPHSRPLTGRTNIILSRDKNYMVEGAEVVHSTEELLERLSKYDSEDVFIIGGESVYKALYPYCDTAIITKIKKAFDADAFFPNLDKTDGWELDTEGEMQQANDICFQFTTYKNRKLGIFE